MSTTTMLTILVAVFGSLLLVLILGLLGILNYPSLGGISVAIVVASIAWSQWQRSRTR